MSFLAPLFFVALAAVAVPIFVHLIQRERRNVIEFPSLMFVRRIPFQSVEKRRIHNWGLLLLRLAALATIVFAFTRPFVAVDPVAAAVSGARDVVILLDRSASMGYGDRWTRAQAEARRIVDGLSGDDRATLVLFDDGPEEAVRATTDRGTLAAAIDAASVSAGATRFAPALRLAQSRLSMSGSSRREAFLISDFQRTGWARQEDVQLPEGATITPVSVADDAAAGGIAVTSLATEREPFSGAERVIVTAGIANRGATPVPQQEVTMEIDGRVVDRQTVAIDPNATASVTFAPITVAGASVQGVVRAGTDGLPKDNEFYFVLAPTRPVSVLVLQGERAGASSLYLTTALGLGREPAFRTETAASARLTAEMLEGRSLVVIDDAPLSSTGAQLLQGFVERGGGLFLVIGERAPVGGNWPLMPGTLSAPVERMTLRGGTLGFLDYSHPVFDQFKDPRNGSFSNMRFLKYRGLAPAATDRVLARFDDGAAAIVERRVGGGRVIALATTLDGSWNDVPRHGMYLPLVHEIAAYLAQHEAPAVWETVGRMFDISAPVGAIVREGDVGTAGAAGGVRGVVVSPSGQQVTLGAGGAESIELAEQGFYSVRLSGSGDRRPYVVAVNLAPEESDLTAMPPEEFLAGITGRAPSTAGQAPDQEPLLPAQMEKQQSIWWYLVVAGLVALLAEAALSNSLSRKAGGSVAGSPA